MKPYQKEMLDALAKGDQAALASIYQHYRRPLYVLAYSLIRDKRACEDIVQEIFLYLWLKRKDLQIRSSLKSYLMAATRYQVFRHIKKAYAMGNVHELPAHRLAVASPDDCLVQKDLARQVEQVVAGLPARCRLVYQLSREEHLSHKEIATRLHLSVKTVENHLTIALRRLRCSLFSPMAVSACLS